jgi:glucose/arabinose dehydrogenase
MPNQYIGFLSGLLVALLFPETTHAQVYPTGFAQSYVAGSLRLQTAVAFAPDGRIFVAEQSGNVRIIKNNVTLTTPFVTVPVDARGERGLIGIAVDPDFLTNNYIYIYYTHTSNGSAPRNRISRFTASNDVATGGETIILDLEPLSSAVIHNGGALHFGPDGKLYVAVGENANTFSAQNLDSYNGKLLRINKDGSVPEGNPFPTGSEQRRRVWAYGLRNPFTFSIDHETGKIFVNDVGQALWEEINDATVGGRNFGWPMTEGRFNQESFPTLTNPVYAYAHGSGTDGIGCAIVGGTFISPSNTNYPQQYRGKYLFQDNCGNWINILDLSNGTAVRSPFATAVTANSLGLTMGIDGLMYICARHGESLHKIVFNNTALPTITNHPSDVLVAEGQPASFSVAALGTPPLEYQWQLNEANIPGATSSTYNISQTTADHAGNYRVVVTNTSGMITSNTATLTVISNALPVAEILTPSAETKYVAGTTVSFSGKAMDPDEGDLPASSMSWSINFHHDTHYHDQPPINGISAGSFTIPQEGETSDNVWYRIILTVADSFGLKAKDSVDIFPMKSTLSFATAPPGLQIALDGQPFNTPGSVVSVEGMQRTIGVSSPQTINGEAYIFASWTNNGTQSQIITTPANDTSFTASFIRSQKIFYRAINLNGPALTIDGNNWEASANTSDFSFGGLTFADQNVTLIPETDASRSSMLRSCIWGNPSAAIANVRPGTYEIYVYVWEDNFAAIYSISLEDTVVQSNYSSGPAGTWRKLGPFSKTISDGTINITAAGIDANLSGIEIWRLYRPEVTPPTVTQPLVDQTATQDSLFIYTFDMNTFAPHQEGAALIYAANLLNDTPLPEWISFDPATRTFSGIPNINHLGFVDIKVTATEDSISVHDVFRLTVNPSSVSRFYRAINLNGAALTIDGNNWEASAGAPNFSYTGATYADQNVTLIPTTDERRSSMIRSFFWDNPSVAISSVSDGNYQVWVYVWEDNFAATFSLSIEGSLVQNAYLSGPAGTWNKLGPFSAIITDGTINVTGHGIDANLSGIEVWGGGRQVTMSAAKFPTETEPHPDGLQLAVYPNPFSDHVKIAFTTGQFGPTRLSMFDLWGAEVSSIFDHSVEKGYHTEIDLELPNLQAGIYILEMINGSERKRLKMMFVR